MQMYETSHFQELLEKRREDFPQAIVAGWMMPDGRQVGACAQVCDKVPTAGELAVAYASCLAACWKKIDELCEGKTEEEIQMLMKVIEMSTAGMEVVARFASGLVSKDAMKASEPTLF